MFYNDWKGGTLLKEQLIKAMCRNQMITIIYMSKQGTISKRRVKILNIASNSFQAYCFTRRAKRTFNINNVLAISPIIRKEQELL